MAKKRDEYPENTSLPSRMQAILNGFTQLHQTMKRVKEHGLPHIDSKELRKMLEEQVDDALSAADIARQAISGDDKE